ncbi:hypothetical protein AbraIFM66951_006357 [Aspergillus brasiliensis]|uniref:Uncharacterized protein n=1 Tax=Aspergillus brasiliensis TaxID=319629 RepID=A0A9W6DGZ1_9EURO|nr:hypothetical protein AbraCBS73388_004250 [Aspergillus brasiliensis]GKZ40823.1 hypothetical protein AbraIFM66951_006357 [Aspergillus brasiliensis]
MPRIKPTDYTTFLIRPTNYTNIPNLIDRILFAQVLLDNNNNNNNTARPPAPSQRLIIHKMPQHELSALEEARLTHENRLYLLPLTFIYFEAEETLLVKITDLQHTVLRTLFDNMLGFETIVPGIFRLESIEPGSGGLLYPYCSSSSTIIPDRAFFPASGLLVEMGISEPLEQLRVDAKLWLECSGYYIKNVLLLKLDRPRRVIRLERWSVFRRPDLSLMPVHLDKYDVLVGFRDLNDIVVVNGPLVLPIDLGGDGAVASRHKVVPGVGVRVEDEELRRFARDFVEWFAR